VITWLLPNHRNSKRHRVSFAIQPLRKICCTFTAAYLRGPGFVLVADLASEIQMIRLFHYRGDGFSLPCKPHLTANVRMAADKISNADIQNDISEAQQCKCENRCVNCFKLQSELHEVRLELKSVKEIANILNRDLASINVRGHNLHEQESSHVATQPFENWPSRHTTKKSYSEVTANPIL
jgi:hypothetical protein